jgi:acyl-coenzyme A thioesterase PaaI-like protein
VATPSPDPAGPVAKPWSGGGREELADAVRRLMALTVTAAAPPEVLIEAARVAGRLADELEPHVPVAGVVPVARFAEKSVPPDEAHTLSQAMPFDVVIGSCNPVALPLTVEFDPPRAIARATFTPIYEGAPGCVHGAVLAGAFDIVLTAANIIVDGAGPTVNLAVRYLKPTLIGQPTVFEAWVTERTDRRTFSQGRLLQGGVVTVEAQGEFAALDRSRVRSMHRRDESPAPGATAGQGHDSLESGPIDPQGGHSGVPAAVHEQGEDHR